MSLSLKTQARIKKQLGWTDDDFKKETPSKAESAQPSANNIDLSGMTGASRRTRDDAGVRGAYAKREDALTGGGFGDAVRNINTLAVKGIQNNNEADRYNSALVELQKILETGGPVGGMTFREDGTVGQNSLPAAGERLSLGAQSIGKTLWHSPGVLWDTAKQYKQNIIGTDTDPRVMELRKESNALLGQLQAIRQGYGNAAWGTEDEIRARINEINAQIDRLRAQDPVSLDTESMQGIGEAIRLGQEATRGMTGWGKDLADAAISIGQNAASMPLAFIHPSLVLGSLGGQAAAQKMYELSAQGVSAEEALARGLLTGGIEAMTEKLPLDNLIGIFGKGNLRNFATTILKQAGLEGTEEGVSYLLNYAADKLAKDPMAQFSVDELVQNVKLGAISGGFFGLGGAAVGSALNRESQPSAPAFTPEQRTLLDDIERRLTGNNPAEIAPENEGNIADRSAQRTAPANVPAAQAISLAAPKTPAVAQKSGQAVDSQVLAADMVVMQSLDGVFGKNGASFIWQMYSGRNGSVSAADLYQEYLPLYEAGVNGRDMSAVRTQPNGILDETEREVAYQAGVLDAQVSLAQEKQAVGNQTIAQTGKVTVEKGVKMDRRTVRTLENVAKALGVEVEVRKQLDGGANGYIQNGKIYVSASAKNPVLVVAAHEITHRMQDMAPTEYRAYRDYVMNTLATARGGTVSALVQSKINSYARANVNDGKGQRLTAEQAMDEIAADYTREMLQQTDLFERFAKQNRTAAEKFLDAVRDFIRKVKNLMPAARNAAARNEFGTDYDTLVQAEKMWSQALKAAETQKTSMHSDTSRDTIAERRFSAGEEHRTSNRRRAQRGRSIEMETMENNRFERLRGMYDDLPENWFAYTGNYFYLYSNESYTDYTVLVKVRITAENREAINKFTEDLENGIVGSAEAFDRWTEDFRRGKGRYTWYSNGSPEAGTTGHDDGVDVRGENGKHLRSAGESRGNRKGDEVKFTVDPDENVKVLDGGTVTRYSLNTWTPETQDKVKRNLIKAGYDEARVGKWIRDVNSAAAVIAADRGRLDFEAADNQVMLKDNDEYVKTLDASTLCAKRLIYQGTFDAIQHRMPDTMLSSDDLIDLLNMMKEHGVQTPCGVCYVESRRRHLGKFAQEWLNKYDGAYKPRLDEVTTSDGLEALRKNHPQAYKDFTGAMSRKGSSNPKVVQLRTEYRNEIMSLTKSQIRKIEAIGGLRVQSFSDFETPHLLDMMQAVMDMSAKGLHSQAYTKVPNFAWVFGNTGIKINLSLIAEGNGFDADGNLAFSSTEGMDINEAMRLRDAYSENVGTIIVGANDEHILACMADDRIDFIIPFHRSGWGMKELEMMGMSSYTDYTYGQKEHNLNKPTKVINGVQQYAGMENLYPQDYWDYSRSGKENAEIYLERCAQEGREPKFSQFLVNNGDGSYSLQPDGSTDGYWKTLIDFKMYDNDGNGAPQQVVQPNFNMEEAHRVLNEYEGGANKLPVANEIVDKFVEKYSGKKRFSVSAEMDEAYMDAYLGGDDGLMQKMVDEAAKAAGYTPVYRYHQTGEKFNEFSNANPDAGLNDSDTPNGYFFKENDHDIGVGADFVKTGHGGDIQMKMFLKHDNMLRFENRVDAQKWYSKNIPGYAELLAKYEKHLNDFEKISHETNDKMFAELIELEASGKSTPALDMEVMDKYDKILDAWIEEREDYSTGLRAEMRKLLNQYFIENDSGYDGIELVDDGHRYIDMKREDVHTFIVFKNTQAKSAEPVTYDDNGNVIPLSKRFNKENPDIRYSVSDSDSLHTATQQAREIARLRQQVEKWKQQTGRNKKNIPGERGVRKAARTFSRKYGAQLNAEDLILDLNNLYDYMYEGGETLEYNEARKMAEGIAQRIAESAIEESDDAEAYREMKDYLRALRISVSDADKASIENYENIRRRFFGRVQITKDGTPIEAVYEELSRRYPSFFDTETEVRTVERLDRISAVYNEINSNIFHNPFSEYMDSAVADIANDIMATFFEDNAIAQQDKRHAKEMQRAMDRADARLERYREKMENRVKNTLSKERDRREKQATKLRERFLERNAAGRVRQEERELRRKIERHVSKLSTKLRHGTDENHIPDNLRPAITAALDAINLSSKNHKMTGRTQAFIKLRREYAAILNAAESEGYDMTLDPDLIGAGVVQGLFDRVLDMGDTPIAELKMDDLQTIWKVVRSLEHAVNTAGKTLAQKKFASTIEWARAIERDTSTFKSKKTTAVSHMATDLETPYTYFNHFGAAGHEIYRMLRNAQDEQQTKVDRIADAVGKIVDVKTVRNLQKQVHTFNVNGNPLKLTTAHVMELYVLNKRAQARDHLMGGGIMQPEIKSAKVERGTQAVPLDPIQLGRVLAVLTDEQKRMADSLQKLMTTTLSDWGNEASLKAYGYKKFTGADYWPIRSANEEIHSNVENGANNARSIKNIGMAKAVTPGASNAVELRGVFQTFAAHAGDMIDYSTWLCPMEDANRLFNFRFKDAHGVKTGKTIKGMLTQYGGSEAKGYWTNLMEDIQNGINRPSDAWFDRGPAKLVSATKAASVGANIRVVAQQPTAILRAAVVLDPQHLVGGMVKGKTGWRGWQKAVKYAPIAARKAQGGYEVKNMQSMSELLYDDKTALNRFNEKMTVAAAKADEITWGRIWNACERQVAAQNKGIDMRTGEFNEKVAELFTEVIDQTQVVDGVLQRSQAMRSSSNFVKQMTAFMGEPTQSLNILMRAWDGVRREGDGKNRGKAMKTASRAAFAVLVTDLVNAFAQSLVDATRDDDEDKKYLERVWSAFTGVTGEEESVMDFVKGIGLSGNVVNNMNPAGRVPYAKDILSIIQGYTVERMDTSGLADFIKAASNLASLTGEGPKTQQYAIKQLLTAFSKLFGISSANILRDVWAISRSVAIERDDNESLLAMQKQVFRMGDERNKKLYLDLAYKAQQDGDQAVADRIANEMIEYGHLDDRAAFDDAMYDRLEKTITDTDAFEQNYNAKVQQIGTALDRTGDYMDQSKAFKKKAMNKAKSYAKAATIRELDTEGLMVDSYDSLDKYDKAAVAGLSPEEIILFEVARNQIGADRKALTDEEKKETSEKEQVIDMIDSMSWLSKNEKSYLYLLEYAKKDNPFD